MPIVSIIIPSYNRRILLERAIISVLKQTFSDWELIVVDDASTDESSKYIKNLYDPRIFYIKNSKRLGAQASRNIGLKQSIGEYIAFLDSDNEWLPNKLQEQLDIFKKENNSIGIVYSYVYVKDGTRICGEWKYNYDGNIYKDLLRYFPMDFVSALIRKDCFDKCGYLDEKVRSFQEWDIFLRITKIFNVKLIKSFHAIYYRDSPDAISKDYQKWYYGYSYIIEKNKKDIKLQLGKEEQYKHYMNAALYAYKASFRIRMLKYLFKGFLLNPLKPEKVLSSFKKFKKDLTCIREKNVNKIILIRSVPVAEFNLILQRVRNSFPSAIIKIMCRQEDLQKIVGSFNGVKELPFGVIDENNFSQNFYDEMKLFSADIFFIPIKGEDSHNYRNIYNFSKKCKPRKIVYINSRFIIK